MVLEFNLFQKQLKIHRKKNIKTNVFSMQTYDSVMSEYFCSKLIDSTFDNKRLTAFVNLFSSKDYLKNKK